MVCVFYSRQFLGIVNHLCSYWSHFRLCSRWHSPLGRPLSGVQNEVLHKMPRCALTPSMTQSLMCFFLSMFIAHAALHLIRPHCPGGYARAQRFSSLVERTSTPISPSHRFSSVSDCTLRLAPFTSRGSSTK